MNSTDSETCKRVHAFFKQKWQASTMKAPDPWVDGCVTWFRNSHQNTNLQQLMEFVTNQWLLVDFTQLSLKSLPDNLQKTVLVNLKENYVLQLMFVINIGQSAYSQHLKITKGQESNSEVSADKKIPCKWEPKGKRMLLLELTDGSQTIQAMEYVPIHSLHLDLFPGTKILIKGPVECRRGVILLRPDNVELLGGEVSDWMQRYAPENVLARLVGKPENPNPVYGNYATQTTSALDLEQDGDDEFSSTAVSCRSGEEVGGQRRHPQGSRSTNAAAGPSGNLNHHQGASSTAAGREKRILQDNNMDAGPPAKKIQSHRNATSMKTDDDGDMFPDDDDDMFLMAAEMPVKEELTSLLELGEQRRGPPPGDVETKVKPLSLPPKPAPVRFFTYLSVHLRQRAENVGCSSVETACVKGVVVTIRGKLEVKGGQWKLTAAITDGSATLDVDFSTEILNQLIGYSPSAIRSMVTGATGEEGKRQANKALENTKKSLIALNCLMHIRWPPSDGSASSGVLSRPTVYRLEDIERRHLEMLQLCGSLADSPLS